MDGVEIAGTDSSDPFHRAVLAPRRLATNHFTGWGYWIWFIPLSGGETSVGLVWDTRLVQPEGRDAAREAHALPRREPSDARAPRRTRDADRGRLPLLRPSPLFRRPVHRARLDVRRRRRRLPRSLLLAGSRPDGVLGLCDACDLVEKALSGAPRGRHGEGLRPSQQALRPLLHVLLRVDLPRQVLRHGRLRHHDDRLPDRHGALLLRRGHSGLPLVARAPRRPAVITRTARRSRSTRSASTTGAWSRSPGERRLSGSTAITMRDAGRDSSASPSAARAG